MNFNHDLHFSIFSLMLVNNVIYWTTKTIFVTIK